MAGRTKTDDMLHRVRGLMQQCVGSDGTKVDRDNDLALRYYFQRERGDEVEGRSNVVSGDLSAMVEANLAQIMESYGSDHIAEYDSAGVEDDDQAMLESVTMSKLLMKDNNGYWEVGQCVKEALLLRNGFMHLYVEEDNQTETIELKDATVEALAELEQTPAVTAFKILDWNEPDKNGKGGYAKVRVTMTTRRFVSEALPKEHFLYLKTWNKIDLQRIPFCAIRHRESRSEMIRRGFPKAKVNRLRPRTADHVSTSMARNPGYEADENALQPIDKTQDLIEWYECFVLVDKGDGTSERRRVSVAGTNKNSLLEDVPFSHVPVVTGTAFINPHRLTSISLFDKLKQHEDKTTGLERALFDNVNSAIKNRTAYLEGMVDPDALDDGRVNGDLPVDPAVGDVNRAITNFAQPDLTGGILANLDFQKSKRAEMGGAALDMQSADRQLSGTRVGSEGLDRVFSPLEMLAAHMTKNFSRSLIRNMYLLGHQIVREYFDTDIQVKVRGAWQRSVPREWEPRTSVTPKLGMSPGERSRKIAALRDVVADQVALADRGMDGVLVDVNAFYRARTDLARMQELPNPEQYFVDPRSKQALDAVRQKQGSAQEQRDAQVALMREALGLERLDKAIKKYDIDIDATVKLFEAVLNGQIAEAKIAGKAATDLLKNAGGRTNGSAAIAIGAGNNNPDRR